MFEGLALLFGSFYVFKPYASAFWDFEVWAAAFWAFDEGVGDFWDKMNCFCGGFIELSLAEKPRVDAGSAFKGCFSLQKVEFG